MSNPIQNLLNKIIQGALPEINSGIQNAIKDAHLDPWGQVAHGKDTLGTINLGICHASAIADYNVSNMRGLSTININTLEITSLHQGDSDTQFIGSVNMAASLRGNLSTNVGGGIEAKCGFLHPHVGISGSASVSGTNASATGTLTASIKGGEVCIDSIVISNASVNFSNVDVHIDGLGIFNVFLQPLIDIIVNIFKSQITGAIASAVTPLINTELKKVASQCLAMA